MSEQQRKTSEKKEDKRAKCERETGRKGEKNG